MSMSSIPDAPLFKGKNNQQKFEATAEKNKPQQESAGKQSPVAAGSDNVSVSGTAAVRSASDISGVAPSTELDQASAEAMLKQTIESILAKSEDALSMYEPNSENAVKLLQEA